MSLQTLCGKLNSTKLFSIIMEFADGGDVYNKIKDHKTNGTNFPEEQVWKIFIDSIKGLNQLHQLKIMHRDLKVRIVVK